MKEKVSLYIDYLRTALDTHKQEFHYITLAIVFFFGLVTRLLPIRDLSLTSASYSVPEAYTNLRSVTYIAENFPSILLTDTSASVPSRVATGTGGVLDFIIGGIVSLIGVELAVPILHIVPVVAFVILFAVLYKIVAELFTPPLAVLSVTVFSIIPGSIYANTVIGSGSFVGLEIAVLFGFVYSLKSLFNLVLSEVTILESVREDYIQKRFITRVALVSILGAFAVALTPGYTLLIFTTISLTAFLYSVRNSGDLAKYEPISLALVIPTVLMTITTAVIATQQASELFTLSEYSLTHVLFGAGTILIVASSILIPRYREAKLKESGELQSTTTYTTELLSVGSVIMLAYIGILHYTTDILGAVGSLAGSATQQTAQQAQNSQALQTLILDEFGLILFGALIGGLTFYVAQYRLAKTQNYGFGQKNDTDVYMWNLLVPTFALLTTIAYAFSSDFASLTAVFVALFTVNIIRLAVKYGDLDDPSVSGVKTYQIIVVVMVLVLFIPGLFAPINGTVIQQAQSHDIQEQSTVEVAQWLQDAESVESDTIYASPQQNPSSTLVSADNSNILLGLGEYPTTGDTEESREYTSRYLLSQSEDEAEQISEEYGTQSDYIVIDSSTALPNANLIQLTEDHPDRSFGEFSRTVFSSTTGDYVYSVNQERYYNSMVNRLYFYHGAAQRPTGQTVAYTQNAEQGRATTYEVDQLLPGDHIRKFDSPQQADRFINLHSGELRQQLQEEENLSGEELDNRLAETAEELNTEVSDENLQIQQGGVGLSPPNSVDALNHHRYVASSQTGIQNESLFIYQYQQIQRYMEEPRPSDFVVDTGKTKVFENVEGATIEGSGAPANSRVVVRLTLENTQTDVQFRYVQQVQTTEDGTFTTTVPYSSENVPEEYTIRPVDGAQYEFISQQVSLQQGDGGQLEQNVQRYEAATEVPEQSVQEGETISIELTEVEQQSNSSGESTSSDQTSNSDSDTQSDDN